MSWLTIVGLVCVLLGIVAYFGNCPYGVHIGVVGAIAAVIGYFIPRRGVAP